MGELNELERLLLQKYAKVAGYYAIILTLWFSLSAAYGALGKWIDVSVGFIWILGAFVAWWLPEERASLSKDTKYTVFFYLIFLLVYRIIMAYLSGITPEMMQASLNAPVPEASGETVIGLLETTILIVFITVPVGFATWTVQHMRRYRTGKTKAETFAKYRFSKK